MLTYIVLGSFTDQGLQNAGSTAERAKELRALAERAGVRFQSLHWTLGDLDFVACVEAPDDVTLAAALLTLAGQGNARTRALRAFDEEEMAGIAARIQP